MKFFKKSEETSNIETKEDEYKIQLKRLLEIIMLLIFPEPNNSELLTSNISEFMIQCFFAGCKPVSNKLKEVLDFRNLEGDKEYILE
jgi:hypothetical protein